MALWVPTRSAAPAVIADFTTQRILHYAALPAFKTYGKGWTVRAVKSAMRATL
jgi:lysozyme family protein